VTLNDKTNRDDVGDVIEGSADCVAKRSHGLEDGDNIARGSIIVGAVDVFCDILDALFASGGVGVTRMEVVQLDS
jgi:hypothetical protein